MSNAIRQNDAACRYGGEEFAVILPATQVAKGKEIANRIRTLLAKQSFSDQGYYDTVTVSCGLAELDPSLPPSQGAHKLFEQADEALYQAKNQGKNQSVIYS